MARELDHQAVAIVVDGKPRRDGSAVFGASLSLALGIGGWELAARLWEPRFLPPASQAVATAVSLLASGQITGHLAGSLASLAIGYAMAVGSGIVLGTLMGRIRTLELVLDPYLNVFLATPKIVLVPVLYGLFGLSPLVQVAVVFLSAFFIVVLNTMRGIQTANPTYEEMARAFGASEVQLFWKVLLPGALPLTMAGVRLAIGRAVKGMIAGEMYITVFGLGGLLRTYGGRFDVERVVAILLVVIAIALICSAVVQATERRLTRWMVSPR